MSIELNTSANNFDSLEQLIYTEGIRIQAIDVHKELDMLIVILNTGSVLKEKLSGYPGLAKGNSQQLLNYELIGKGTGIHWPAMDEDLSLKGILRNALKNQISGNRVA